VVAAPQSELVHKVKGSSNKGMVAVENQYVGKV
jgi:hypothetical protein